MEFIVDVKNEIIGYAKKGGLEGSIKFNGTILDGFEENFKPAFYLLQENEIVINPNYQEPTIDIEPSGPSPEMLAINALGLQVAKLMAGGD